MPYRIERGLLATGISDEAMAALMAYRWPGNTRELRNVLERGLVLAGDGTVELEHLPMELQETSSRAPDDRSGFHGIVESYKRKLLLDTLREADWSKKRAAAKLGLSQRAFSHYVAKYELDEYREGLEGTCWLAASAHYQDCPVAVRKRYPTTTNVWSKATTRQG